MHPVTLGGKGRSGPAGREVAAVVLAAGGSSRWGEGSKLLAPLGEGTLLEGALGSAREAGLRPILVVLGHRAGELRAVLPGDAVPVEHPAWREGRASTVAAGVRAAREREGVGAAALLLGDEPRVSPGVIRAAVALWRDEGAELVRTVYGDRPGHPVVVDRSRFEDLVGLTGEEGVRRYLERNAEAVRLLRVEEPGPDDVDTPEDLRGL